MAKSDWFYVPGDHWITCDVCSKKTKASEARQRWDGLIVCPSDFEHRHEQDYVRARTDKITVPFTRPIPTFIFTNITYINQYVNTDYVVDGYILDPEI